MAGLRIARDLALPIDIVTQAIAILARKGAGKTYTAKKLVELVIGAKVPVVVIDPTGAWWGLRTSTDGERPGLPVVIFGGEHADVPLERGAGREIADVVLEHAGAYILDLSGFESRTAEQTFVADFLERLYRGKKRETGPLLLVVDEADMFAPQRPGPEQTRSLGALEAIVRRGRIKGLGDLLISQRAAVLNKNVLTQTEVLVVMQTTGPQDRAAIDAWIEGNGTREERDTVLASLASLERGEAWVWSPSFLRILQRVRILPGTTFDSSRTPEAGETTVAPRAFAQVDVAKLGERITAAIEKAKAEDPKELRRRIQQLERAAAAAPAPPEVRVERVEVPVLNGQVDKLDDIVGRLTTTAMAIGDLGKDIGGIAMEIVSALGRVNQTPTRGQVERAPRGVQARPGRDRGDSAVATLAPAAPRRTPAPIVDGPVSLDKAQRALLTALAQFPDGMSKVRLSLVAGYSIKSSSFSNALGALRSAGLVERGSDPIRATVDGLAVVPDAPPAPTSDELLDYWLGRLDKAQRAILTAVVAQHPNELTKDELSELSGYSVTSSSFSNAIGALRSLGLLERGGLRATEDLGL